MEDESTPITPPPPEIPAVAQIPRMKSYSQVARYIFAGLFLLISIIEFIFVLQLDASFIPIIPFFCGISASLSLISQSRKILTFTSVIAVLRHGGVLVLVLAVMPKDAANPGEGVLGGFALAIDQFLLRYELIVCLLLLIPLIFAWREERKRVLADPSDSPPPR